MEPSVGWVDGIPPSSKTPYVETERFSGTGKVWRVWLLGDARCVAVHYTPGQSTKPCVAHMGACPLCVHPLWWKRTEAYAPAMLEVRKLPNPEWVPLLAIFTAGGYKQIGPTPHRGRMFDVSRISRGERCSPQKLVFLQTSDPLRPAFDMEPLIKRLWWPEQGECVVDLPAPIPIPPEEVARTQWKAEPAPIHLSPEELARLVPHLESQGFKNLAAKLAGDMRPEPQPTLAAGTVTPSVPEPEPRPEPIAAPAQAAGQGGAAAKKPRGKSVFLADPDELARRKSLRDKPAEELTATEAAESGRVVDYVAAGLKLPPSNHNGHAKKGGAQ